MLKPLDTKTSTAMRPADIPSNGTSQTHESGKIAPRMSKLLPQQASKETV